MDVKKDIVDKVKVDINIIDRAGEIPALLLSTYGISQSQSSNDYLLYS